MDAAAVGGRIIHVGGEPTEFSDPQVGCRTELTIYMMKMSNLIAEPDLPAISSILMKLLDLTKSGLLEPEFDRTYDLEEATEAIRQYSMTVLSVR